MTGEKTNGQGLLEALIDGERAALKPGAGAKRRTWKRVANTVAIGAPLPVEPSTIAGPSVVAAKAAPWLKVVLGVVLGGAVGAAGFGLLADEDPPAVVTTGEQPVSHEPRVVDTAPPPSSETPKSGPTPAPPAAVAPPDDPPGATPPPVAAGAPTRSRSTSTTPARAAPSVPVQTPSTLAEETRLLAEARAHLRSAKPTSALEPLTEHARRFPKGQLSEDRMVLRAQALCESGDKAAGLREAAALKRAFPASSHLPRVRRACDAR
ncbi:MAG: hypothetical protein AAF721_08290 [Myxococcota bacterium]